MIMAGASSGGIFSPLDKLVGFLVLLATLVPLATVLRSIDNQLDNNCNATRIGIEVSRALLLLDDELSKEKYSPVKDTLLAKIKGAGNVC